MEKIINSYESLFIVDVQNGETVAKETVSKFTAVIEQNAVIIEVSKWGKRRLAYPINDRNEGYYTVITFKSAPEFPTELDRLYNIDEHIMRSMTIRLEKEPVVAQKAAVVAEVVVNEPVAEVEAVQVEEVAAPAEAVQAEAVQAEAVQAEATAEKAE